MIVDYIDYLFFKINECENVRKFFFENNRLKFVCLLIDDGYIDFYLLI